MPLATRTVTGTFVQADGVTPCSGTVSFVPNADLSAASDDVIVPARRLTVPLDATGKFSVALVRTDAPGITPTGWAYEVTIRIGSERITRTIALPAGAGALDLADALPLEPAPALVSYALAARQIIAGTGLSGGGDLTADRTLTVTYGTTAGTAAQGNDSRLSDARTPTAHAASHAEGGSDQVTLTQAQITGLVAALAAKLALTGGTLTGALTVTTSVTVRDQAAPTMQYRFRFGADMDTEGGGRDWWVSVWANADFTGAQRTYLRMESGAQLLHLIGRTVVGMGGFDEPIVLDPTAKTVSVETLVSSGKNGLSPLRICGRKDTAGAPTSGTWSTGDSVWDSAGKLWYCTAGGTPGTWV